MSDDTLPNGAGGRSSHSQTTDLQQRGCVYSKVYADVFYLFLCGITPIAICGIVLNVINLAVFRHMQKTATTSVFLLRILAGCDLFFLTICLIYFGVRHMIVFFTNRIAVFALADYQIAPIIAYVTEPFYYSSLQARNWLIVVITFERFLNLVFPLWAKQHCTKRNLGKVTLCIFLAAIGLALPRPVNVHLHFLWGKNPCNGVLELQLKVREDLDVFRQMNYILATVLVPMFLIYTMNITLIISVRNAMRRRQKMMDKERMRSDHGQTQATLTVISIVILFTICETLPGLDRAVVLFAGSPFPADNLFYNYARKTGLFLIVFDSAMNFVAYCFSNRSFRESFRALFRRTQIT
jgi:hypothetical protein